MKSISVQKDYDERNNKLEAEELAKEIFELSNTLLMNEMNFIKVKKQLSDPILDDLMQRDGKYYRESELQRKLEENEIYLYWVNSIAQQKNLLEYKKNLLTIKLS